MAKIFDDIITIAVIVILGATLSSCTTALRSLKMPEFVDVSRDEQTATIQGSKSGFNGYDCYILEPSLTKELRVDAGNVSIRARCHTFGNEGPDFKYAGFDFNATPDHNYQLVGYSTCMGCGKRSRLGFPYIALIDLSDEKKVVLQARFGKFASSKTVLIEID